jgi:hypothetical protein
MHEVYKKWCEKTKVPAALRKVCSEVILVYNQILTFKPSDVFLANKATVWKKNITYT